MKNHEIKDGIARTLDNLKELEARAGKLENKNLRDIIATAAGRLHQATNHPDLELIGSDAQERAAPVNTEQRDPTVFPDGTPKPLPFDPKAGADVRQSPAFTFNAPGSQVGGPDQGKEGVHTPGEPRFDNSNAGFQQPDAVDLNADGTLRQAPNSKGAPLDVREDGAGQK